MHRRHFLSQAAGASALALTARSYSQINGANNRVRMALAGCGTRGLYVAKLMRKAPNVEYAAVCDVYQRNALEAKAWAGEQADAYGDFRRALDRDDIDAIHVATPDHWHAIPTVLACQAGKDVYVEKPLAHNIREGRAMVDAARRHDRIVQMGSQHRSGPHFREVQEIVGGGEIGAVRFVRIWNFMNTVRSGSRVREGATEQQPQGLDWDFYLGPAPKVPYEKDRFLGNFRWYFDYAGGLVTDWGTHRLDAMRQIMNEADPVSVSASGGQYESDAGDTPDVVQATVEFPTFMLSYEAIRTNSHGAGGRTPGMKYYRMSGADDRPHGTALYGTKGTIIVDRIGYDIYPEVTPSQLRRTDEAEESETSVSAVERRSHQGRDATDVHALDFIESIRTRKPPSCDVEIGHRSTIVPHLINIAYRTGRKFHWDAESETINDEPAAAALLTRQAREPWDIVEGT